jgi:hypothetical protein
MTTDPRKSRKAEREAAKLQRKDRLIQTRVDRRLQKVLLEEARRRRMSVSNLVRNVLEDAFGLTDPDVGRVVDELEPATPSKLEHVYAWNPVVLGRDAECSRCARSLASGERALIGLSDDDEAPRAWLCEPCGKEL